MTFASICSGIGGFDLGFEQAGLEPLWLCEINKACRTVLNAHWPALPLYDDMCGADIESAAQPDILTAGSPCQGFSVAGLRKSLSDERSNLCLRLVRLTDILNPAVLVWENVPGVLSTADNAFGCFLAGLVGADAPLVPPSQCGGRWTNAGVVDGPKRAAAWRVLDSQYLGVAQRRERVFVVASARKELPFQVLFEPESCRRHHPPRREAGQNAAPTLSARTSGGGGLGTDCELDGGLIAVREVGHALACHQAKGGDPTTDNYVVEMPPIISNGQAVLVPFDTTQLTSKANRQNPQLGAVCHTLAKGSHAPATSVGRLVA